MRMGGSSDKGYLQGQGPYAAQLKKIEGDIKEIQKRVNEKIGEWPKTSICIIPIYCSRGEGIRYGSRPTQSLGYPRRQAADG